LQLFLKNKTMANSLQPIWGAVAFTTSNNPEQVQGLLARNGVVVPAALTTTQLNEAVIMALAESDGFRKDFSNYLLQLGASKTRSASMSGYKNYTEDFFNSANGGSFMDSPLNANGPQPFNFATSGGTPEDAGGGGVDWEAIGKFGSNLAGLMGNFFQGRQAVAVAKEQTEAERIALERAQTERETAGLLARTKSAVTSNPWTTALIILGVGAIAYGAYYFYKKSK
jgi:hypothetical protein